MVKVVNAEQVKAGDAAAKVQVEVKISKNDLPLSCPMPNMSLWNMHPKVYLALDADQQAMCEYCSTLYILTDE